MSRKRKGKTPTMDRNELKKRGAFRLRERHLWPEQFRGGHRSIRVEWDRIKKMIAQLPLEDLPEYAQQWIWMLERTTPEDVAYCIRRGDFPYFDAWAHRFHILDEMLRELGYKLPGRTPFIYGGYIIAGFAATAQMCFREAGGPERFASAFATDPGARSAPAADAESEPPA